MHFITSFFIILAHICAKYLTCTNLCDIIKAVKDISLARSSNTQKGAIKNIRSFLCEKSAFLILTIVKTQTLLSCHQTKRPRRKNISVAVFLYLIKLTYFYALGKMTFLPPIYGCNASGMVTLPSACKWFSTNAINIRGGATTVLFNVCASLVLPSSSL